MVPARRTDSQTVIDLEDLLFPVPAYPTNNSNSQPCLAQKKASVCEKTTRRAGRKKKKA